MTIPSRSSLAVDSQWREIAGRLVALAHLANVELERNNYVPLHLAGTVLEAANVTLASYEAFVTTIGRAETGKLPDDVITKLRVAVRGLRTVRATIADLAPTLDTFGRGHGGR